MNPLALPMFKHPSFLLTTDNQVLDPKASLDPSIQLTVPLDAFVPKVDRPAVAALRESIDIPAAELVAMAGKINAHYSGFRAGPYDARKEQLRREYASQPPLEDFTLDGEEEEASEGAELEADEDEKKGNV